MKTFHEIVHKYRFGAPEYSNIHKFIKEACVSIELSGAIMDKQWQQWKEEGLI